MKELDKEEEEGHVGVARSFAPGVETIVGQEELSEQTRTENASAVK